MKNRINLAFLAVMAVTQSGCATGGQLNQGIQIDSQIESGFVNISIIDPNVTRYDSSIDEGYFKRYSEVNYTSKERIFVSEMERILEAAERNDIGQLPTDYLYQPVVLIQISIPEKTQSKFFFDGCFINAVNASKFNRADRKLVVLLDRLLLSGKSVQIPSEECK
jgi:hypothetical protein